MAVVYCCYLTTRKQFLTKQAMFIFNIAVHSTFTDFVQAYSQIQPCYTCNLEYPLSTKSENMRGVGTGQLVQGRDEVSLEGLTIIICTPLRGNKFFSPALLHKNVAIMKLCYQCCNYGDFLQVMLKYCLIVNGVLVFFGIFHIHS